MKKILPAWNFISPTFRAMPKILREKIYLEKIFVKFYFYSITHLVDLPEKLLKNAGF